jgi:hypothetical protein
MGSVTMHVWSTCIDPRWPTPLTDLEKETYYAEREKDRVRREKAAQVERDKEQARKQELERIRTQRLEKMRAEHRASDARNQRRALAIMIPAVLGIVAWDWGIREPEQVRTANSFLIRMLGGTEVTKEKIRTDAAPAVKKGATVVVPKPEKSVPDPKESKPPEDKLPKSMETVVTLPAERQNEEPTSPEPNEDPNGGVIDPVDNPPPDAVDPKNEEKPKEEPPPELTNPHQDQRPGG